MVNSNVVVAGSVLWSDLGAFLIPSYSLAVLFLCASIGNTDIIGRPHILGESIRNHLQCSNLPVDVCLIAGKNEMSVHVVRV